MDCNRPATTTNTPAMIEETEFLYRELAEKALLRYRKRLETHGSACQRLSIISQSSSLYPEAMKEDVESVESFDKVGGLLPQKSDVLFGRRRSYRLHPGNIKLRNLCDEHLNLFESLAKGGKNELTKSILNIIAREGGRFIKYDSKLKQWLQVAPEEARVKIAHRFRDARTSRDVAKKPKKESKASSKKVAGVAYPNISTVPRFPHPPHALEALQTLMYR